MDGLPVHGLEQWLDEVMLFSDWYCPAFDIEVDRDAFRAAWAEVLAPVQHDGLPRVTVLRDFHAETIMLVRGKDGIAHYGLLDFKDALVGHRAYDPATVLDADQRAVSRTEERCSWEEG